MAELAAAGHTNREVAQALFLSVHTVEDNLGRIYRKLGIRSRTELAAKTRTWLSAHSTLTVLSMPAGDPATFLVSFFHPRLRC